MELSCQRIQLEVDVDTVTEGSFTVFGLPGRVTEGYVVSSDLRMQCVSREFSGVQDEIFYRFDAHGMEPGEEAKGTFYIISNQGEYYIPFSVSITVRKIVSGMGEIKNLFHFTNLAKSNWEEAVKLFYAEEFAGVFTGNDKQHYAAYQGLSAVRDNEHNVEEFLLEINKKRPVEYLPEETEIRIEDPEENIRYTLVVNRNGWGYTHFRIATAGEFLQTEEEEVTETSFLGNIYRLYYYVNHEKLHNGNNYDSIGLIFDDDTFIEIPVTVVCRIAGRRKFERYQEKKALTVELMDSYQTFRLKRISTSTWMAETNRLLNRLMEIDDRDIALKLFQAQIMLTEERYNEARWMIEKYEDRVAECREEYPELWCYYLYLTTLYSREDSYVDEVAETVSDIYVRNRGNWRIAWLLMYLSEEYSKDPMRKWRLLEEVFRYKCTSPVIYIEAWHLLCMNPAILMKLDLFEQQILSFAVKHGLMKDEIILQIVYLSQKEKQYSASILRILKGCYALRPQNDILHAICTLLIKGNCFGAAYFEWYKAGVERNLRITRLYEYYMMSAPLDYSEPVPKIVLMYFAYQSNLSYEITAYLYAYVHKHRAEMTEIYINYTAAIERFVAEQMRYGRINRDLAYLYRNVISLPMIDEESAAQLATLLFLKEIRVWSDKIVEVLVVYPYGVGENVYPVSEGKALIPVYDSDCKILLGDREGNRYTVSIGHEEQELCGPARLALMIAPFVRDNLWYGVYTCFEYQKTLMVQDDNVDLYVNLSKSGLIAEPTKKVIRMMLVRFFYSRDRMRELDDYLMALHPEDIQKRDRREIVRCMVVRGMYEEAWQWVRHCGPNDMDAKVLLKLCSRLLDGEEIWEEPEMTGILAYVVQRGKYDENVLDHLVKYFRGSIKEMRDIWKMAESFGVNTYALCERMLEQMLYTGAHVGEKIEIFRTYNKGMGNEELRMAFLSQCCYDYMVKEQIADPYIFWGIMQLYQKEAFMHRVCKMAFLQYYAENRQEQDERVRQTCCAFLQDLLAERILLPLYKDYQGYIPQMDEFQDKTLIEYRVKPGCRAVIHYMIQDEGAAEGEYCQEEMRDMFGGICVKEFILFFGERLQYYITEESENGSRPTRSNSIAASDMEPEDFESRYTILNDIMIGKTLHDYDTVNDLMMQYYRQDFVVDHLFKLR